MLNIITHTIVSIVRASANIRNGITIKLTEEKIKPPMQAKAKKTKVPVKNIAAAFKFVPAVINLSRTNLSNNAKSVKYQ